MRDTGNPVAAGAEPAPRRAAHRDIKALAVLAFTLAGASLIVNSAEPMASLLVGLLVGPEVTDLAYETVARTAIGCSVTGLAVIGLLILGERPSSYGQPAYAARMALPAGMAAVALAIGVAWLAGDVVHRPFAMPDPALLVLGALLTLLGVAAEELLLRGLLQPVLVRAWGSAAGIGVTALAFMLIHMVGGWGHPVSLLNILLAGIWFGLLAWRTGGLLAPISAHFGYNATEELLFGASPNPGLGVFGAVTDFDLTGPAILGGSIEGLNASLAVSFVLVAFILPLARGARRPIRSADGATTA